MKSGINKTNSRHELDLAGQWLFQIDQDDIGEKKKWFIPEHDRHAWQKVAVPNAWDFYTPELKDYEGVAWYALELPTSATKKTSYQRIIFKSVNNHARVWLNGRFAGEHWGSYLPFEVDFPGVAVPGKSQILVLRVDNMSKKPVIDFLPGTPGPEWTQYGGILQKVKLLSTPKCYISDFHITATPCGPGANISFDLEITNKSHSDFYGQIRVKTGATAKTYPASTEISCKRNAVIRQALSINLPKAKLWSPQKPALYDAEATLESAHGLVDWVKDRFGIRTITANGRQILLNGSPIVIKGFNRYDELGRYGPTPPVSEIRKDLLKLKKTGANTVRVHYPQDPVHMRIMDEIGLLLMSEVPLNWWRPQSKTGKGLTKTDRTIIRRANEAMKQMILRDRNHPCIFAWSMCNECGTSTPAGSGAVSAMLKKAKKLDPARLVTYVTDSGTMEKETAFAHADIVCKNSYHGLFSGKALDISEFQKKVFKPTMETLKRSLAAWPGKPLVITEFGTHSLPGFRGTHRFTEDYQSEYLRTVWRAINKTPGITGGIIWAWADYRHQRDFCPKGCSAMFQAPYGPYGVVSIDRKPKLAYATVAQLWDEVRVKQSSHRRRQAAQKTAFCHSRQDCFENR